MLATTICAATTGAFAWTDQFAYVYGAVTDAPNERQTAVLDGMRNYVALSAMVRDGRIRTPYDCIPEIRVQCFDTLKNPTGDEPIQEWGEWRDAFRGDELRNFVANELAEAAERGFNLFTNEEIANFKAPPVPARVDAGRGKTWADMSCRILVSSKPSDGFLVKMLARPATLCRIYDWPIRSPTARLSCDDGTSATMEIVGDSAIQFSGYALEVPPPDSSCGNGFGN